MGGAGWVGSYPLLSLAPTHVEVELGCDNIVAVAGIFFIIPTVLAYLQTMQR